MNIPVLRAPRPKLPGKHAPGDHGMTTLKQINQKLVRMAADAGVICGLDTKVCRLALPPWQSLRTTAT